LRGRKEEEGGGEEVAGLQPQSVEKGDPVDLNHLPNKRKGKEGRRAWTNAEKLSCARGG